MNRRTFVGGSLSLALISLHCLAAEPGDEFWDASFGTPGVPYDEGLVSAILHHGGLTYFAGGFSRIGGVEATNVAAWNGTNWSSLGSGVVGGAQALAFAQGELYAAGNMYQADGKSVRHIAKWNGIRWNDVGGGLDFIAFALASDGTNVYAGGHFTEAGGVAASKVARWDGQKWSALGSGITPVLENGTPLGVVFSLVWDNGNLYVGGEFRIAGGVGATNIARWDGTNWHALGNGLRYIDGPGYGNGSVRALTVHNGILFAGGDFRRAGDVAAINIAQWDGAAWRSLGSGVDDHLSVLALAADATGVYAAGPFQRIGGVNASHLAKWDGTTWAPLGSGIGMGGLGGGAAAITPCGTELFVGGLFTSAGGKPSSNIALWHIPHALSIRQTDGQTRVSWPSTGTNYMLESKADLSMPVWSHVSQPVIVNNDECVVLQPTSATNQFYRLRSP